MGFYNVDMKTGKITRGGSNAHWYEVGLKKVTSEKKGGSWTKQGVFLGEGFTKRREAQGKHPDTGLDLVGKQIPQLKESLELCKRAHEELCPSVPLAGWDVVLVDEEDGGKMRIAPLLLEVNLSCNFFLGSFDEPFKLSFIGYRETCIGPHQNVWVAPPHSRLRRSNKKVQSHCLVVATPC